MNGVIAERDALAAALAAKTEQVAGLLDERQVLRAQRATLSAVIARITEYPVLSSAHTDGAATWLLTCSQADLQTLQLAGGSNAKTG